MFFAHLSDSRNMVDTAVIENENTTWGWIWVHLLQETLQPFQKLITIVASGFNMTVEDTADRQCRKNRVSIVWSQATYWRKYNKHAPLTPYKPSSFSSSHSRIAPAIESISCVEVDRGFISKDQLFRCHLSNFEHVCTASLLRSLCSRFGKLTKSANTKMYNGWSTHTRLFPIPSLLNVRQTVERESCRP